MALNTPRTLQTLLTGDSAASRAFQNVKTAVDPVLGFINSSFQVANDGSMAFLRKVKTFAADAIIANSSFVSNGKASLNAGMAVVGASTVKGTQVIQKLDDGSQGSQLVQGNLTVLGNTSSSTGFKCFGPIFSYNGSIGAGAYINMGLAGTGANMPHKYPFAGSVVGSSISFYCSATTSTLQFYITGSTGDILATYNPNNFTGAIWFSQTYAKGTRPFAANGDLICKVYCPTAISSIQLIIAPLLEFGA